MLNLFDRQWKKAKQLKLWKKKDGPSIKLFLIKGFIDSRYQYFAFNHFLQYLFIFIEGKK